jgi:hypothetical protein
MTLLARTGNQPGMGSAFGLHVLAGLSSPHPIWLVRSPDGLKPTLQLVHGYPATLGVVVLLVVGAITALAWVFGRKVLAAVAAVAAICSLGTVVTFVSVPAADVLVLTYLDVIWWITGILLWIVAGWVLVVVARPALRRLTVRWGGRRRQGRRPRQGWANQWWPGGAAVLVAAALVISALFGARALVVPTSALDVDWTGVAQVDRVAPAIEAVVPRGPVLLEFREDVGPRLLATGIVLGIVYRLTVDGWHPGLHGGFGVQTGSVVPPGSRWPIVVVTVRGESGKATVVRTR